MWIPVPMTTENIVQYGRNSIQRDSFPDNVTFCQKMAKSGQYFPSLNIPNIRIFELPVDFIHIYILYKYMLVISQLRGH